MARRSQSTARVVTLMWSRGGHQQRASVPSLHAPGSSVTFVCLAVSPGRAFSAPTWNICGVIASQVSSRRSVCSTRNSTPRIDRVDQSAARDRPPIGRHRRDRAGAPGPCRVRRAAPRRAQHPVRGSGAGQGFRPLRTLSARVSPPTVAPPPAGRIRWPPAAIARRHHISTRSMRCRRASPRRRVPAWSRTEHCTAWGRRAAENGCRRRRPGSGRNTWGLFHFCFFCFCYVLAPPRARTTMPDSYNSQHAVAGPIPAAALSFLARRGAIAWILRRHVPAFGVPTVQAGARPRLARPPGSGDALLIAGRRAGPRARPIDPGGLRRCPRRAGGWPRRSPGSTPASVRQFPDWETLPYDILSPHQDL